MAIIKKKTDKEYFELVKAGKKKFEIRVADFEIKEGDTLILEEKDSKTKRLTGREIKKKVKNVFHKPLEKIGSKNQIAKHGLYIIQLGD